MNIEAFSGENFLALLYLVLKSFTLIPRSLAILILSLILTSFGTINKS